MNIIFPQLYDCKKIDPFWEQEAKAAQQAGFGISLATDANTSGPIQLSNITKSYLYRGWIVKPQYYSELDKVTSNKLINNYDNYMWSYDFNKWYFKLYNMVDGINTPYSYMFSATEVQNLGLEKISQEMSTLGKGSFIIKDFLKSRKHEWFDACFIKDISDTSESVRIMKNFFELQGRDFYGGLVFREYVTFKKLGNHPKSNMPLPIEFRTFFVKQKPLITSMYWNNDISYPDNIEQPPQEWLEKIGKMMQSPFVALDIAQGEDGKWWVIEVNDGGTAGYPNNIDEKFYKLLYNAL